MNASDWRIRLERAWRKVKSKKGPPGSDGLTTDDFACHSERELDDLADEIAEDRYYPYPFKEISSDTGGKTRLLVIPAVRDRVAASAVAAVLSEQFDPTFSDSSYAYRPGRSIYMAWRRLDAFRSAGYLHGFRSDISKCFASLQINRVISELILLDVDGRILGSVESLLRAKRTDGRSFWERREGIAEGLAISPVLANIMLDPLDKMLDLRSIPFLRYADDLIAIVASDGALDDIESLLRQWLFDHNLFLNEEKSARVDFASGFTWLGAEFIGDFVYRNAAPLPRNAQGFLDVVDPQDDQDQAAGFDETVGPVYAESAPAGEENEDLDDAVFMRTLYLEGFGTSVGKSGRSFVIKKQKKDVGRIPADKLGQIILFPGAYATTPAMQLAIKSDIPVTLIGYGTFGRVESTATDRVVRQRLQFLRAEDPDFRLRFSKECVRAKITNSHRLLRRKDGMDDAVAQLRDYENRLDSMTAEEGVDPVDQLRGMEGAAAAAYFAAWKIYLKGTGFQFGSRRRRPPPDPINAMLSFGYTLLFYEIYSIIRLHGLHPYVGHLHAIREGHPALVSDLIEEWRAPIVDSVVLALIGRRTLKPEDFAHPEEEGGACLLSDEARKTFIDAYERKLHTRFTHPATGYRVSYRRAIDLQVRAFIRFLDGRVDHYQPFFWEG